MATEDECSASEFADMVERAAAKFRTAGKMPPCGARALSAQRERFDAELEKEIERRAAARARGAAARPESVLSR